MNQTCIIHLETNSLWPIKFDNIAAKWISSSMKRGKFVSYNPSTLYKIFVSEATLFIEKKYNHWRHFLRTHMQYTSCKFLVEIHQPWSGIIIVIDSSSGMQNI